ncbi:MAG: selenocysteine-specific translation elongation factor [Gemmatimonadota bacterium]|nr:MAG: selenocysteine-specific translation elongation factor [Gemmatimonadota bacterium]
MRHIIIGTAGHIDHGKTALILALTGIETDRLKEEKERGLSIDLGFAYFDLPGGQRAGIVDVPGHERFVKNMLAGAVGMDLVLLVVAADEGVMPQTREHLDILRLLQVEKGLAVITKTDLTDEEQIEFVEEDIKETVAGTFLEGVPILRVSSTTGDGIEKLKTAIEAAVQDIEAKSERGSFRLPIDRVFTMKGFGTVVTGTVFSGSVGVGETLEVLPSKYSTRVRGVQVHNQKVEHAYAGQRTALNLPDLEKSQLRRGNVLATPDVFERTEILDTRLVLLESTKRSLEDRTHVQFHLGTTQVPAQVILFDRKEVQPGDSAMARIKLEEPVVALKSDQFILRKPLPLGTIGGGQVIDIRPQRFRRKEAKEVVSFLEIMETGRLENIVHRLLQRQKKPFPVDDLKRYLNVDGEQLREVIKKLEEGDQIKRLVKEKREILIGVESFNQFLNEFTSVVKEYFEINPYKKGMPKEEVRSRLRLGGDPFLFDQLVKELETQKEFVVQEGKVFPIGRETFLTSEQQHVKDKLEKIHLDKFFEPPAFDEIEKKLGPRPELKGMLNLLVEEGTLIRTTGNVIFHRKALEEAMDFVKKSIQQQESITVAQFRDRFHTSRKYSLAILEYFDRIRLTRRVEDERVLLDEEARIV